MDPIGCGVGLTRRLSRHNDLIGGHRKMLGSQIVNGSVLDPGEFALIFGILINLLGFAGERDHRRNDRIGLRR